MIKSFFIICILNVSSCKYRIELSSASGDLYIIQDINDERVLNAAKIVIQNMFLDLSKQLRFGREYILCKRGSESERAAKFKNEILKSGGYKDALNRQISNFNITNKEQLVKRCYLINNARLFMHDGTNDPVGQHISAYLKDILRQMEGNIALVKDRLEDYVEQYLLD